MVLASQLVSRIRVRASVARELLVATYLGYRDRRAFDEVEVFCLFIGYPRSGHSLVGSLLDAHPDIVLSHELDAMKFIRTGLVGRNQLFALVMRKDQQFTGEGRRWTYGFDYSVPGQWQGRHRNLRVIGDKKGGATTTWLAREPDLLTKLEAMVDADLRLIHVTRHPLDNIASMHRRGAGSLKECAALYLSMCATNDALRRRDGVLVRDVRHEDLVADPAPVLIELCRFLGLEAEPQYLAACAAVLYSAPHRSRDAVEWPPGLVDDVSNAIETYDFLRGYGFDL